MKVKIIQKGVKFSAKKNETIKEFVKFLQKKFPLKKDFEIMFLPDRVGKMTTGSRTADDILRILVKKRMLIDVLRTLSHEWIHEYEHQILNWHRGPDIGGKNENFANINSGILMKEFQKQHPELIDILYDNVKWKKEK